MLRTKNREDSLEEQSWKSCTARYQTSSKAIVLCDIDVHRQVGQWHRIEQKVTHIHFYDPLRRTKMTMWRSEEWMIFHKGAHAAEYLLAI